jgi:hypothetical protein
MKLTLFLISGVLSTGLMLPTNDTPPVIADNFLKVSSSPTSGMYQGELHLKRIASRKNFDCDAEESSLDTSFTFDQGKLDMSGDLLSSVKKRGKRARFLYNTSSGEVDRKFIINTIPRRSGEQLRITIREIAKAPRKACLFLYRGTFSQGALEPSA